jgi:hypothetical protein
VVGANLDCDDPDAGHRFPDDRYSGRGQTGMLPATSRTWIQIITERPAWPAVCPET